MTDEMSLAVFDPIRACIAEVQEKNATLALDHTTPTGEKELRSWVATVRGYRAGLEKVRVKAKADSLEYGRAVDKLAKELKAPFDTIISERMKPLDDIEDAKRKAAEAVVEAERVEAERVEAERLADLKRREDEVARKEAEQREVERIEREKRIADSAAQTAREETEEKAERERLATIAAAQAEEARLRHKKEQAEEAERRRTENEDHRKKIERGILSALYSIIDESENSEEAAEAVLSEIRRGEVPHVTINY